MKRFFLALWRKFRVLFSFLMAIPLVSADLLDIFDLPRIILEEFLELLASILNVPVVSFLGVIQFLFTTEINIQAFFPLWQIMIYLISLFYGVYILFAGFNLMTSGYDPIKRMLAKEWLKNVIIMMVFVQSSYFIYKIILEVEHSLTTSIMSLVGNSIFYFTAGDILSGFGIFLMFGYGITLFFSSIFFFIRYIIIIAGVLFFPLGIFLYFSPAVKDYGRMILNFLIMSIFISFFSSLILLASSRMLELPTFRNYRAFISMTSFFLCNMMMFYFLLFSIIKSAFRTSTSVAVSVAKFT